MRSATWIGLLAVSMATVSCAQQVDDDSNSPSRGGSGAVDEQGGSPNSGASGGDQTSPPSQSGGSSNSSSIQSAACPPACGPDHKALYDNGKLASIRITFDSADLSGSNWLDLLWNRWVHCEPYNPVRVTFEYDSPDDVGDVILSDVGMRLRGSMKRGTNDLQGFKLDFHKPFFAEKSSTGERRRFGEINRLNELSLEPARSTNTPPDVTHMIQCLAYKYLRDFGIPAPFCNHLKVYVQGSYYGLMENVEEADHGKFLEHHFGTPAGLLVEASPSGCGFDDSKADLAYHGASFSNYNNPPRYNLERGTQADAEATLFPMFQCADAAQTPDDQAFASCIQEWLDVDEWLRLIAAESLMPELESLGYIRNFYLYFHPEPGSPHGGRFLVYTWDLDAAFKYQACKPQNCDPFSAVSSLYSGERLPIIKRLLTVFKPEYCAQLNAFLDDVFDPSVVADMGNVMAPGMTNDPTHTEREWTDEVIRLRDYVQSHRQEARATVASACSGT